MSSKLHIVLPGLSRTPIGGYKVAYEYANALAAQGVDVTVWHTNSIFAYRGGRRMLRSAIASLALWTLSGRRAWQRSGVEWFRFDPRVEVRSTGWFPAIDAKPGDAILATAIQSAPFVAERARRAGAISAILIQHYETWADSPEHIAAGWGAVDERIVIAPWLADKVAEADLTSNLLENALVHEDFPRGAPLEERPRQVLSLLAPHAYKRPDVVIGVLTALAASSPGTALVTFGQAEERPDMPEQIRYVSNPSPETLRNLYQSSQVYFCGSDAEGWHLPPAEATLSGAAVVSTDIGGVRASMRSDALFAPAGAVDELAEQVLAALDDLPASQERVERANLRLRATTYASNSEKLRRILQI